MKEIFRKLSQLKFWTPTAIRMSFGPEFKEIDKEVAELVRVAQSVEYGLWIHYNAIGKSYVAFINSADRKERENYLKEIREAAGRLQDGIKRLCYDKAIRGNFVRTIDGLTFPNLDNLYLNLTQLFQLFIAATTTEAKMHYLTPIFFLCNDIIEMTAVTSPEPNPHLEAHRK